MGYEKGDILKMSRKTNLVAGHDSGYEIVGKYYKIGVAPCHLNFQFVRSVTGQFFYVTGQLLQHSAVNLLVKVQYI